MSGHGGWQELAPRWERGRELLWESTRAVGAWLVDALDPRPGQTILDVAAGTGETGFLATERLGPEGLLISSDRSPNMVDAARRLAATRGLVNVEFRVLDSGALALGDVSVDGVLSRFGYVLRGDPPPALREIRRVLRPGGRFAFAVWAERARNAWMTVPADVMVERGHLPAVSAEERRTSARRTAPVIAELLAQAGFGPARIEELPVTYRFADADELWFFVSELRGPVAIALGRLDEQERRAIRTEIEERVGPGAEGGFELGGMSLNVVTA